MWYGRNGSRKLRHGKSQCGSQAQWRRGLRVESLEPRCLLAADPVITEFVASNETSLVDESGSSPDWIEIYNAGDTAANLQGWYLTDDEADLAKWRFPSIELEAGRYLVVLASGRADSELDTAGMIHADFRLAKDGEYLALVRPDQSVAFEFSGQYPEQRTDVSYGLAMTNRDEVLVDVGAVAHVMVPAGPIAPGWTGTDDSFDDQQWTHGLGDTLGVGYSVASDRIAGVVAEWTFETHQGSDVVDGMSALGEVDESGRHAEGPFWGLASGGPDPNANGLTYATDAPSNIGSTYSLEFPIPETAANHVRIPLNGRDGLAALTEGDFRVEAWFKTTDSGRNILTGSYSGEGTSLNLELHTRNRGRLYVQGPQATTDLNVTLPTDSRDGEWHHLAGVRDGQELQLFFDGEMVGSRNDEAGGFVVDRPATFLGRDHRKGGVVFNGSLDNVRFYNTADRSSLVASYDFETLHGESVQHGQSAEGRVDETAFTANVPLHGVGTSATGDRGGVNYAADAPSVLGASIHSLQIDESNASAESVQVDMAPAIANLPQGDFTMQTWFKSTDTDRGILMGSYTGPDNAINLELHTDNRLRIFIQNTDRGTTDLNVPVDVAGESRDGQWHLAAAVRRGDRVELYFDGVLVGQTTDVAGAFTQSADQFYLGRDSRLGNTRFDGSLDDVRLWDVALTADQIQQLATGAPPEDVVTGSFKDLVGTDVETQMRGHNGSVLIRVPFDVRDPAAFSQLSLHMISDDGFVAYLNGHEVAQSNAPQELSWNSTATAVRSLDETQEAVEIVIGGPADILRRGENILAIHGLNQAVDDDTFWIVPRLVGIDSKVDRDDRRFFTRTTPGQPNAAGVLGFASDPVMDVARGFYETDDLDVGGALAHGVTISTTDPDATIRYTVDGSWPDLEHGTVYDRPIRIDTTTTLRAVAFIDQFQPSNAVTHTYLFLDDVIRQPDDPGRNTPGDPTYPVEFPLTHQAGVSADYEMDPRVVQNPLYAQTLKDDLLSIPTMSLVMDVDDVFGQPRGIWSNSEQDGRLWERLTSVEYFDPQDPQREFHVNSAIRIQGRASRSPPSSIKHSFRLIFKDTFGPDDDLQPTGGPAKLEFPLFPESPVDRFDTIVLRAGYNYSYLHGSDEQNLRAQYIRERFMRESQLATEQLSPHGSYVHLYVNGLYFGLYAPQERPDASFMAEHLGGSKDDYDVISAGVVRNGTSDAWDELLARADKDLSIDENYHETLEMLDVDSLIDYMIVHVWGGTTDWPAPGGALRNWVVGRKQEQGAGFKFFVWDAEYSLQSLEDDRVNVNDRRTPAFIYSQLRANPDFRIRFADRVQQHFFNHGALSATANIDRYASLANEIEGAIVAESARWGDTRGDACNPCLRDPRWIDERDWMLETYLPDRTAVVLDQFRANDLFPSMDAPVFKPSGGGIPPGLKVEVSAPVPDVFTDTQLVSAQTPVQVLVPKDDSLGVTWTQSSFVPDQEWIRGAGGVGFDPGVSYESLIDTDVRELMYDQWTSAFTRFEFDYDPTTTEFDRLRLRMRYDDGFVAYLNGIEIARSDTVPREDLTIGTTPSSYESREFETFDVVGKPSELLADGRNVLAIHGLNRGSRSDFLILPELVGQLQDTTPRPRPIWYTADGTDPRLPGGDINPNALQYEEPLEISEATRMLARVLYEGEWSALTDVTLRVETEAPLGDFNHDMQLNHADIDLLCSGLADQDVRFDINHDERVDLSDLNVLIGDVMNTSVGDADLDGAFDENDLAAVFRTGEYEDGVTGNSTWQDGDWNCDGEFTSEDLVAAFRSGGYVAAESKRAEMDLAAVGEFLVLREDQEGF